MKPIKKGKVFFIVLLLGMFSFSQSAWAVIGLVRAKIFNIMTNSQTGVATIYINPATVIGNNTLGGQCTAANANPPSATEMPSPTTFYTVAITPGPNFKTVLSNTYGSRRLGQLGRICRRNRLHDF